LSSNLSFVENTDHARHQAPKATPHSLEDGIVAAIKDARKNP